MTWGDPAGMEAAQLVGAMKPLLLPPPPGAPGPFALSDEAALRAFAVAGGLTPGALFDVGTWSYPDEATGLRGLACSGVATTAMEHAGKTPSSLPRVPRSCRSASPTAASASARASGA